MAAASPCHPCGDGSHYAGVQQTGRVSVHFCSYAKFRVMQSRVGAELTRSRGEAQITFHNPALWNKGLNVSEAVSQFLSLRQVCKEALTTSGPPARKALPEGQYYAK
jgi:hypothetical protein